MLSALLKVASHKQDQNNFQITLKYISVADKNARPRREGRGRRPPGSCLLQLQVGSGGARRGRQVGLHNSIHSGRVGDTTAAPK